jgi:DNA-binding transcriptional MocR family regulator
MSVVHDLATVYRRKISSHELNPGDRLPIEGEMAELHGVSRSTISRLVQLLKSDGLVHTTYAGTFVGPRPVDPRTLKPTGPVTVACNEKPWCNNTLEFPAGSERTALIAARWLYRGSVNGRLYYCHQHAPEVLARERKSR